MTEWFAIGDVHGCYEQLEDLLAKWDKSRQQLVFMGDLIDRGLIPRPVWSGFASWCVRRGRSV